MTRDDLINMVARKLELLPAGQTIEADIKVIVDSVYDTRWSFLVRRNLAYFPKHDIPEDAAGPLSSWLASYAAEQLLDAQGIAEKAALRPEAERDLRILAGDKTNSRRTKVDYF